MTGPSSRLEGAESDAENTAVDRDAAARVAANVLAHYGQRLQAIRLALGYRSAAGFAARAGIPAAEYKLKTYAEAKSKTANEAKAHYNGEVERGRAEL